jgi:KaiC/GvpD/RAD55 family RecA-like ATPase
LNDSNKLKECINRSVTELEARRNELGARELDIEKRLETVRNKAERLGIAFADGAVSESAYLSKLKLLKKEETDLIKHSRYIDIEELGQIVSLGIQIDMVKEALSKGRYLVVAISVSSVELRKQGHRKKLIMDLYPLKCLGLKGILAYLGC